jgi:hypothetical protein
VKYWKSRYEQPLFPSFLKRVYWSASRLQRWGTLTIGTIDIYKLRGQS